MGQGKVEFHLHVHGDVNSEIEFENKVSQAFTKAAQGGAFSDVGIKSWSQKYAVVKEVS